MAPLGGKGPTYSHSRAVTPPAPHSGYELADYKLETFAPGACTIRESLMLQHLGRATGQSMSDHRVIPLKDYHKVLPRCAAAPSPSYAAPSPPIAAATQNLVERVLCRALPSTPLRGSSSLVLCLKYLHPETDGDYRDLPAPAVRHPCPFHPRVCGRLTRPLRVAARTRWPTSGNASAGTAVCRRAVCSTCPAPCPSWSRGRPRRTWRYAGGALGIPPPSRALSVTTAPPPSCLPAPQIPPRRVTAAAAVEVVPYRESIYLAAEYLKLDRSLSQTPWCA